MKSERRKMKHAWMVEDAPSSTAGQSRSFWTKIGVAYETADGSLSLHLAAVPVSGKMQIRDATPVLGADETHGAAR